MYGICHRTDRRTSRAGPCKSKFQFPESYWIVKTTKSRVCWFILNNSIQYECLPITLHFEQSSALQPKSDNKTPDKQETTFGQHMQQKVMYSFTTLSKICSTYAQHIFQHTLMLMLNEEQKKIHRKRPRCITPPPSKHFSKLSRRNAWHKI